MFIFGCVITAYRRLALTLPLLTARHNFDADMTLILLFTFYHFAHLIFTIGDIINLDIGRDSRLRLYGYMTNSILWHFDKIPKHDIL